MVLGGLGEGLGVEQIRRGVDPVPGLHHCRGHDPCVLDGLLELGPPGDQGDGGHLARLWLLGDPRDAVGPEDGPLRGGARQLWIMQLQGDRDAQVLGVLRACDLPQRHPTGLPESGRGDIHVAQADDHDPLGERRQGDQRAEFAAGPQPDGGLQQ